MDIETVAEDDAQPRLTDAPVARLAFVADTAVKPDALFDAIPVRRSNKEVY